MRGTGAPLGGVAPVAARGAEKDARRGMTGLAKSKKAEEIGDEEINM